MSTSAAAHACSCNAGSACSEYWKIKTGMFGNAFVTSVCTGALLLAKTGLLAGRRALGVADHGAMVWDEMVAFLFLLAIVPRQFAWQAAAFFLFRVFDIAKPPPIRWFERRYHGGFGVMFDDLLAAGYTLLVLAVANRLLS